MGLFNNFPYMDLSNLNLDFILKKLRDLKNYVDSAAQDAETAVNAKDDAVAAKEAAQLSAENAALSEENAGQSAESAQNYAEHIADPVGGLVTGWLDDNITPTTPPVDASLTIQGAAADAKATGDAINNVVDNLNIFSAEAPGLVPQAPSSGDDEPIIHYTYTPDPLGTGRYQVTYPDGDTQVEVTEATNDKWEGVSFGTLTGKFKGVSESPLYIVLAKSATHMLATWFGSSNRGNLLDITINGAGNAYTRVATGLFANVDNIYNKDTYIEIVNNVVTFKQDGVVKDTADITQYLNGMTADFGACWTGPTYVGRSLLLYAQNRDDRDPEGNYFLKSDATWGTPKPANHWSGKQWYAYGTSITNTSSEGKYADKLARMGNLVLTNKGISGGGIGDLGASSRGQVYDAICNITDGKLNADLITLETGANDCNANVPLGTVYDTGRTTLAGCLNDCLRYLQENTSAQIVVFNSPASTNEPNAASQYYTWAAMVEEICKINRVHFVNANCNLGYAKLSSSDGSLYVVDSIHQTDLGGYIYAENIWSQLKDIPLFYTQMP